MASRRLFLRHTALPAAAGILAASALTLTIQPAYAESPEHHIPASKKPIYDDGVSVVAAPPSTSPTTTNTSSSPFSITTASPETSSPSRENTSEPPGFFAATRPNPADPTSTLARGPTPTDRLTAFIRQGRLQLYNATSRAESLTNDALTRALRLESSFTSTVASLAPPPSAHEPLVPGLVYVLVATLAGSIVSRNRGFLLRAATPLGFGLGAAYVVLPFTMRNVGDLAWKYEKEYPVVADTHLRVRERVERFWETGKAHTVMGVQMAEQKVDEARQGMEDWVRKGR